MKRLLLTLTLLLAFAPEAWCRGKLQGYVEKGGASVTTGGHLSTTKVQQSYPSVRAYVYYQGTTTVAPIYSAADGTALANPFTVTTTGKWEFFADDGCFDIVFKTVAGVLIDTLSDMCIVSSSPEFSITTFGAKADSGTTNNTTAIQAAITAACAANGRVKVPAAVGYYSVSSTVTITCSGLTLEGDGVDSVLYKSTAGDLLQIGDNVTQINDVTIRGINFNGTDTTGWSVNARKAPNTLVEWCNFANSSTGSGALRMSECWNSRIVNNTVGSLKGTGFRLSDSTNSVTITGNRIDGYSGGSATAVGMYLAATTLHVAGNTAEGVNVGIDLVASVGVAIIGNYFENNSLGAGAVDIRTSAGGITSGLSIISNYFAPNGIAYSIDLDLVRGVYIGPNVFANTAAYTSGSPIRINSNAQKVKIDLNEQNFQEGTGFDYWAALGAGINGGPVTLHTQHTGDLTVARNIFKVKYPGGPMRIRVRYYLNSNKTDLTSGRSEVYGSKVAIYSINTSGTWTQMTAFADEITEKTKNTGSTLTLATANGDFSGGYLTAIATNYSGANALAHYIVEVTPLADGVVTLSKP